MELVSRNSGQALNISPLFAKAFHGAGMRERLRAGHLPPQCGRYNPLTCTAIFNQPPGISAFFKIKNLAWGRKHSFTNVLFPMPTEQKYLRISNLAKRKRYCGVLNIYDPSRRKGFFVSLPPQWPQAPGARASGEHGPLAPCRGRRQNTRAKPWQRRSGILC